MYKKIALNWNNEKSRITAAGPASNWIIFHWILISVS